MGILEEDIQAAKNAVPIVDLISKYTTVKQVGRSVKALCPFHNEKTPSLSINPETNVWFCFGCQAKGDTISFLQEIEHIDFATAVERLAQIGNITLRYSNDDDQSAAQRQHRAELVAVMQQAVEFYQQALQQEPQALAYLHERGITDPEIEFFQIGFCPVQKWALSTSLGGTKDELLFDCGLLEKNRDEERGGYYEPFRGRVIFPIFNPAGEPVSVAARLLPNPDGTTPTKVGKYKNTRNTRLYDKSRVLYGLNWAKSEAVRRNHIIVCEGYTDVIAMHRVGFPNAVAGCGTAFGDHQARTLRRYSDQIVLAYDADAAGQQAIKNFFEWGSSLGLATTVVNIPDRHVEHPDPDNPGQVIQVAEKTDPGDLAVNEPDLLVELVTAARPLLEHLVEAAINKVPADATIEERAAAAETIARDLVGAHHSKMVQTEYLSRVAAALKVDVRALQEALDHKGRTYLRPRQPPVTARSDGTFQKTVEVEALRVLANNREDLIGVVEPWMFEDPACKEICEHLLGTDQVRLMDMLDAAPPAWVPIIDSFIRDQDPLPPGRSAYALLLESMLVRYLNELRFKSQADLTYAAEYGQQQIILDQFRAGCDDDELLSKAKRVLGDWRAAKTAPVTEPSPPNPNPDPYDGYDNEAGW